MTSVIDTNRDMTPGRLSALKAQGVKTVIGYLTPNTTGEKLLTPAEARNVAAAGMRLGLVFQVYGGVNNFSHNDINSATGAQHAAVANRQAAANGAPAGAVIWFAIDTDARGSQVNGLVLPYFAAVRRILDPKYRVGVYGCGAVCDAVLNAGHAKVAWLSNAMGWNGSRAFLATKRWSLLQKLPTTMAGISADPDVINPDKPDIGDFVPYAEAQPNAMQPHNVKWMQEALNKLGYAKPPLAIDGDSGPLTEAAIRNFQGDNPPLVVDGVFGRESMTILEKLMEPGP